MTDNEEHRKVNAVSDFLRRSCRIRPSHRLTFADFFRGLSYPIIHPVDGLKCKIFPVSTGSAAEFYIEPMLSCVGDTDVMHHYSSELAIPEWYPPPSQLPAEFETRVKVYEIKDSRKPGYVYLNLIYILARNTHDSAYVVAEYVSSQNTTLNHELYVSSDVNDGVKIQGPAHKIAIGSFPLFQFEYGMMTDAVPCIRCFEWPPQASEWPKRHRNSGWPDSATVDQVIRQGCDVVGVAHRQYKQVEWERKHQWRLSFSRAEVVLLNSWTPVQQIVYHMLRIFMKTKRLTGSDAVDSEADTLSNYHIKTLMLWTCELKPQNWCNDGSTLVRKCIQMLLLLEQWLKNRGPHYFINNAHFLDNIDKFSIETVFTLVRSTTEDSLAQWFIDNYIRQCAELCPDNSSLMCSDLIESKISEEVVNIILQWKDHISNKTLLKQLLSLTFCCIAPLFTCFRMAPVDVITLVRDQIFHPMTLSFTKIDAPALLYSFISEFFDSMTFFGNNLAMLYFFECTISDFDDLLCFDHSDVESSESHNLTHFQKAVILMGIIAIKHFNIGELIQMKLSKAYLQRSLMSKGCDDDSTYCLTNVYLAVLHYTTGQYQRATDHCTLVTRSQDHSQCSLNVVQGNLLPKIDDDIDSVLGLVVFYQYVRIVAFNQQHQQGNVNIFTTEMFAHYLSIKHLCVAKCRLLPKAQEEQSVQVAKLYLRKEVKLVFDTMMSAPRLLVSDLMLCKLPNNRIVNRSCDTVSAISGRRELISLMTQLSIQQLLTCRHEILPRDTESIAASDITDLMALYLYRCQLYERCEQLCERRIRDLIDAEVSGIPRVSTTYHEFIQLMDEDVVSLIGLTVLLNNTRTQPLSLFREPITITQLTLSLYLLIKCQTRFRLQMQVDPNTLSSLTYITDWIEVARKMIQADEFVDHLILKLAEQEAVIYVTDQLSDTDEKDTHCFVAVSFGPNKLMGVHGIGMSIGFGLEYMLSKNFQLFCQRDFSCISFN